MALKDRLILAAFLLIFTLLTLPQLLSQNLIGDEAVYLTEGDRYLHQPGSFYYNSGSPHLLKSISALFYYTLPLNRNYDQYFQNTHTHVWTVGEFIYDQNTQFATQLIQLSRVPHLILALILGILIYLFTKKYFGRKAAAIALALYALHPLFLAHAYTANLDLGTTAYTYFTLVAFYLYLTSHSQQKKLLLVTGILLGLTQATKISAILLYPFFIFATLVLKQFKLLKQLPLIFAISFITLWGIYGFQIGPIITQSDDPAGFESVYGAIPIIQDYKLQITNFLQQPIFPAGAFFNNFTYQFTHSFYGHTIYLNGEFTDKGLWYFIPVLFVYKNSLILLLLIAIALITLILTKSYKQPLVRYLLLWIILMTIWSVTNKLQLGIRYIMPIFPAIFILTAKGATELLHRLVPHKLHPHIIAATLALYSISTLTAYPTFFTYTNELLSTQNPINYIYDSDYDWGQSVYKIGEVQKKQNLYPLYLTQFGGASAKFYQIESELDAQAAFQQKKSGYYAFSHTALVGLKISDPEIFNYFSNRKPDTIIDHTIYVYQTSFN